MSELKNGLTVCRLPGNEGIFGLFRDPVDRVRAGNIDEVIPAVQRLQQFAADNCYAVGYISYEASPAFDSAFEVKADYEWPLLDFFIYDKAPQAFSPDSTPLNLQERTRPELAEHVYCSDLERVLRYIYEGDIYQANYTFRADLASISDPFQFFNHLVSAHPVPYAAYLSFEDRSVVSVSPELFLEKNGTHLISKPMKGTASRHPIYENDRKQAAFLSKDPKNRAENLMIVDMVRNDFGRICQPGTIKVDPLFHVDTYSTVHQMISTVHGQTEADLIGILKALFPAASITGAPKVRAMQIIRELEHSPREVYCGAVGCIVPGGDFCFNVPIRTLLCEKDKTRLGIGSGVVADSQPHAEWQESLLKSRFVFHNEPEFEIFETLAWLPETGYSDLEEHLERMRKSQLWFLRPFPANPQRFLPESFDGPQRIKFIIDSSGAIRVENTPLSETGWGVECARLMIADETVNSTDYFLYHKTTKRDLYSRIFTEARSAGFNEALFFNEKGFLTEGTISNVFVKIDGKWLTPALSCGLLPGIERAKLIAELQAEEVQISRSQLKNSEDIIICNSLRGQVHASLL